MQPFNPSMAFPASACAIKQKRRVGNLCTKLPLQLAEAVGEKSMAAFKVWMHHHWCVCVLLLKRSCFLKRCSEIYLESWNEWTAWQKLKHIRNTFRSKNGMNGPFLFKRMLTYHNYSWVKITETTVESAILLYVPHCNEWELWKSTEVYLFIWIYNLRFHD